MNIKIGELISLRHYSKKEPLRSIVVDTDKDSFWIKITDEFASINCFVGDNVVVYYGFGGKICSVSCTIIDMDLFDNKALLDIDNMEIIVNHRKQDRFLVSLYAIVKQVQMHNNFIASVRDLSLNGMMICSKSDISIDQKIEIEIHTFDSLAFINADVMWKLQDHNNFKYGLKTNYNSEKDRTVIESYIEKLRNEQDDFINKLKK